MVQDGATLEEIRRAHETLREELDREPSHEEIAGSTSIPRPSRCS
ncbi:MAG: sigma-70 domain-containing protein [Gemmatimonadota bacterium]